MNNVSLVGRLTRDPELRYTPNGIAVANFNLAVNRPFKDQNGESGADFISCVVFRKAAENLANYQKKGNQLGVTGRIQTSRYEKDGRTVYSTQIVAENVQYLDPKSSGRDGNSSNQSAPPARNQSNQQQQENDPFRYQEPMDIKDDDLPF